MTDSLDRLKSALADNYAIDREIGSGGMATAYLAHDVKHDRKGHCGQGVTLRERNRDGK